MGYCGVPITLVTTSLPVILMTVAVTDEIHLLDRFRQHLSSLAGNRAEGGSRGAAVGRTDVRLAIESALRDVARPVVLTSLTTSIAFLSFLTATIAPIRHFGLFTALGVLLAMVLSFTFVPALVLLLPGSWFAESVPRRQRTVPAHERFVVHRRAASAAFGVLLVLISVPGLLRLSIQGSWIDNFDPASPLVSAEREFNSHFWGSYRFDVILTSEEKGFFRRPEGLWRRAAADGSAVRGPVTLCFKNVGYFTRNAPCSSPYDCRHTESVQELLIIDMINSRGS